MKCDVDTFARMYEEIYKDLYRFALCMMKNEQDAEDAVSDAVLSGYENIRKLRDEKAFKSWMFTILANTCKKKLQNRSRKFRMEKDMESSEPERNNFGTGHPDYGISVDVHFCICLRKSRQSLRCLYLADITAKKSAKC